MPNPSTCRHLSCGSQHCCLHASTGRKPDLLIVSGQIKLEQARCRSRARLWLRCMSVGSLLLMPMRSLKECWAARQPILLIFAD